MEFVCQSGSLGTTKEEIAEKLWRENYNPLAHESRVYTTVRRLRDFLESLTKSELVETVGARYRLNPEIKFTILDYEGS